MARRLDSSDRNFKAQFEELLFAKREEEEDVVQVVRGIIADVRKRGDVALVELTNKFDRANVTAETLKLSVAEIDVALQTVSKAQLEAIEIAAQRKIGIQSVLITHKPVFGSENIPVSEPARFTCNGKIVLTVKIEILNNLRVVARCSKV